MVAPWLYSPLVETDSHIDSLQEIQLGWCKSGYENAGLGLFTGFDIKFDIINGNSFERAWATESSNADYSVEDNERNDRDHNTDEKDKGEDEDNHGDKDKKENDYNEKILQSEMFSFIRIMWRRFNNDHDYHQDDHCELNSEDDLQENSVLMDGKAFTQVGYILSKLIEK